MRIDVNNFIQKVEDYKWGIVCWKDGNTFNLTADGRKCEVDAKKGLFRFSGSSWIRPIGIVSDKSYIPIDGFKENKEKATYKKKFVVYVEDGNLIYITFLAWYVSWKLASKYGKDNVITKYVSYSDFNIKENGNVPVEAYAKNREIIYIGTSGNWKYITQYSDIKNSLDAIHKLCFGRSMLTSAASTVKGLIKFDIYPNSSLKDEIDKINHIFNGDCGNGHTVEKYIFGLCKVRSLSYITEHKTDILDKYFNSKCPELLIDVDGYKSIAKDATKYNVTPELIEILHTAVKVGDKHVVIAIEEHKEDYCRYWSNYALYPVINLVKKIHSGKFIICNGIRRVDVYITSDKTKELAGYITNLSIALKAAKIKSSEIVTIYLESDEKK